MIVKQRKCFLESSSMVKMSRNPQLKQFDALVYPQCGKQQQRNTIVGYYLPGKKLLLRTTKIKIALNLGHIVTQILPH